MLSKSKRSLVIGSLVAVLTSSGMLLGQPSPLHAAENVMSKGYYLVGTEAQFSDISLNLKEAIEGRGLVIDFTGHVGKMLARTGPAVGQESPYLNGDYLHFCSAKLTHAAVAANPENIAICPLVVFAYELKDKPGQVMAGYRRTVGAAGKSSEAALKEIDALLRSIVDEALQ